MGNKQMINFKEYLTELFDKPAKTTILSNSNWGMSARFKTESATYVIEVDTHQGNNVEFRTYDISFYYEDKGGTYTSSATNIVKDRHVVFATVLKFVNNFYKKWPGHEYKFSCPTHNKSRIKLYDVLVKKFADKNGLKITKSEEPYTVWRLSK